MSTSVPSDVLSVWLLLQEGALRHLLPFVAPSPTSGCLFCSSSVIRLGASMVGTTCSRLPVPNPHLAASVVCVPVGYVGALAAVTVAWMLPGLASFRVLLALPTVALVQ